MNISGAKLVVVGGAGFIGSHVVDQLLAEPVEEIVVFDNLVRGTLANLDAASRDRRVRIVEGSIMNRAELAHVMRGADGVFHLAALWLFECVHDPRAAIDVNIGGTFNVLEAAQQAGVRKVVYSSSASVYGDALVTPMSEDHPFNNRTMYSATKIAGEQFCRLFFAQHQLEYIALRYMNVYGPRMDARGAYVSVIVKVLDRIGRGLPPVIFGDGTQTYDFIHVDDVARANVCAMTSAARDEVFNVGVGIETTINDLVERLLLLSGSSLRPEYQRAEQMFVTHRVGSTNRARAELGFEARIPLDRGLRTVVAERLDVRRGVAVDGFVETI